MSDRERGWYSCDGETGGQVYWNGECWPTADHEPSPGFENYVEIGPRIQEHDAVIHECAEKVRSFENRWPSGIGAWTLNDVADELLPSSEKVT